MARRRTNRGFTRAADLSAAEMGLPTARARELLLARAWHEVAGETVVRHAPALGVRRGVVEIALPDGAWGRELRAVLPELAARLAAYEPALGVSRFRLVPVAVDAPEAAQVLPALAAGSTGARVPASGVDAQPAAPPAPATLPLDERLRRAIDGYLGRIARGRDPGT